MTEGRPAQKTLAKGRYSRAWNEAKNLPRISSGRSKDCLAELYRFYGTPLPTARLIDPMLLTFWPAISEPFANVRATFEADRGKRILSNLAAVSLIVGANLLTFWGHYTGGLIFPWDFLGTGYHAQAVAWFEDGGIFSPPAWLPYGSMGFPGWWSLQSGSWYLPLQFLHWLGIEYTFRIAAAFQAAHVALGALGALALLRRLGASLPAATLGALVYHFSSIFFSNQEHVDIVRAAALLPWLLYSFEPGVLRRHRAMVLWSSLLTWQFLMAAYPGMIVSGGYTATFVLLWWLVRCRPEDRISYLVSVLVAGIAAVLMAMVKWLTPTLLALGGFQAKALVLAYQPEHLFTFLFRYDLPILRGDPTMQSLWSPPLALLILAFVRRFSALAWLAMCLIGLALIAGSLETFAPAVRQILPGFTISRLPHSDWRPTLHLGSAMLAAALLDPLFRARFGRLEVALRASLGANAIALIALAAIAAGYGLDAVVLEVAVMIAFLVLLGGVFLVPDLDRRQDMRAAATFSLALALVGATSFLQHGVHVSRTWKMPWSEASEVAYFGRTIADQIQRPRKTEWPRRPSRTNYGNDPRPLVERPGGARTPAGTLDVRFNRAWYAQEFGTFGYDNLGSAEFKRFIARFEDPALGDSLLAFMLHPGQAVFEAPGTAFDSRFAASCPPDKDSCALAVDASARILSYRLAGTTYEIRAAEPVTMVENEMEYAGWRGRLCDKAGRCLDVWPAATDASLRVWDIPAGEWRLTTRYAQPFLRISLALFALGVTGLLAFSAVPALWSGCGLGRSRPIS
jgi:hypothetical protein